jgi:CheY-like chemotaxis protein
MSVPKSPDKIPHIILADDDEEECLLFKDALEHKQVPFMFSFVSDGKMLLNLLDKANVKPDFIFIDLHRSALSSAACMEELKTRKVLQKIPVIVYSGSAHPGDKDYCYNTKASEYFLTALDYLI